MGTARHCPLLWHQRSEPYPYPKPSRSCSEVAGPADSPPEQRHLTLKSPEMRVETDAMGFGSPAFSPQEELERSLKFFFPDSFQEQDGEETSNNLTMNAVSSSEHLPCSHACHATLLTSNAGTLTNKGPPTLSLEKHSQHSKGQRAHFVLAAAPQRPGTFQQESGRVEAWPTVGDTVEPSGRSSQPI